MAVEPQVGSAVGSVRIAELVATLSYAADLGLGQPMEHCMRQTVIALRLADLADANEGDREATYYLAGADRDPHFGSLGVETSWTLPSPFRVG